MSFSSLQASGSTLKNLQQALDVAAHNIANVSTTAYKAKRVNFEAVTTIGVETNFSGADINSISTNFQQGRNQPTNEVTDLAIQGNGFFTVQNADGNIVFTRDGHFTIDAMSDLVTADGSYVLSAGGGKINIPIQATALEINSFGEIRAQLPSSEQMVLVDQVQLATFINPQGLESIGSNFYQESVNSGVPEFSTALAQGTSTASTAIRSGFLEGSNADLSSTFVDLMAYQRSYQAVSRAVTTANDILETTLNI
ncbi:MAG: flagellar basal body rod protein FlgG [Cyanobacteriota bacterium]|jgi:flagellar basal body rod protein FlgG